MHRRCWPFRCLNNSFINKKVDNTEHAQEIVHFTHTEHENAEFKIHTRRTQAACIRVVYVDSHPPSAWHECVVKG